MTKVFALLFSLFLAGASWAQPVIPLTQFTIPINIGATSGIFPLIAGIAGQRIYVTAALIWSSSASQIYILGATNTVCAGPTAIIQGPISPSTNTPGYTFGNGSGVVWALSLGATLCLSGGAGPIGGSIGYAQF